MGKDKDLSDRNKGQIVTLGQKDRSCGGDLGMQEGQSEKQQQCHGHPRFTCSQRLKASPSGPIPQMCYCNCYKKNL